MSEELIFLMVIITAFLQIIHIFEEIHLEAYNIMKGKVSKRKYFFVAAVLVLLNYIVIILLYFKSIFGYYAALYTVLMSVGNTLAHFIMYLKEKDKKTIGYGLPSSIPLGISGIVLFILLLQHLLFPF